VGLLAGPAGAASLGTTVVRLPISVGPDNTVPVTPCPNDTVNASGTLQIVSTGQINNSHATFTEHFTPINIVGADANGNAYRLAAGQVNDVTHFAAIDGNLAKATFTDVETFVLVGQGNVPNLKLHVVTVTTIDLTVNPPTITVRVANGYLTCG
jgi:hypothetical protein